MDKITGWVSVFLSTIALLVSVYALATSNKALALCQDTQERISVRLEKLDATVGTLNTYCERITTDIMRDNQINFYGVGVSKVH